MKLPIGLTAHVGEVDAQHGVVHLKAIGSVVPANTAVIITGEPGTYTLTATTEAPQSFAKNDLKGTSTDITASAIAAAPEAYYALSINQGQPCFGILERDLPAGKAYFTQPKSAGAASQFLSGFVIRPCNTYNKRLRKNPLRLERPCCDATCKRKHLRSQRQKVHLSALNPPQKAIPRLDFTPCLLHRKQGVCFAATIYRHVISRRVLRSMRIPPLRHISFFSLYVAPICR